MKSTYPMIELRGVHRFFEDTHAVNNVSFQVERGQVFGYIGPNGAGKTTSMRILATLDCPDRGEALIDGFSVVEDPDRVRVRVGFMPDYFGTYANVTVREYLDFFARAYDLRGKARLRAIDYVERFTQLDRLAHKPINGLSKGMKQRLCLGRAMIHDPAVLILDEPAAGLDPRARIELRQMIRALATDGKTILVSSHILTELGEMCDVVGIIEKGQLLAVGSVSDIHRTHETRRMVRIRVLDNVDALQGWLAARQDVQELTAVNGSVHFLHHGDEPAEAEILREMVTAGFRVVSFGSTAQSLEEVFLKVTKGQVQ